MSAKIKAFLIAALTVGVALPLSFAVAPPTTAVAQYIPEPLAYGTGVGTGATGTTSYYPVLIQFVGQTGGGTVEVAAATGDITLKTGPVAGSAADTTTECPVSGALGGIIDVSDAACNTLGEVVDAINASSNWRAVIQDGLRSDSSNNTLTTLAETAAAVTGGLALAGNTTVSLNFTHLFSPSRNDIRFYYSNGTKLNANPFNDSQAILWRATDTFTGTGADVFEIWADKPNLQTCSTTATAIACTASAVETLLYSEPGGGSTVNKSFDFTRVGFWGRRGERFLVRGKMATTLTAVTIFGAGGHFFQYKPGRP